MLLSGSIMSARQEEETAPSPQQLCARLEQRAAYLNERLSTEADGGIYNAVADHLLTIEEILRVLKPSARLLDPVP
jgi:hypothetical protein